MNPDIVRMLHGEIIDRISVGRVRYGVARHHSASETWVWLSRYTLLKQLSHHPELELGFYEDLEWLLKYGEYIGDRNQNAFHIFAPKKAGETTRVKATLKVVRDTKQIFVLSIHNSRNKDYKRLVRRAKN